MQKMLSQRANEKDNCKNVQYRLKVDIRDSLIQKRGYPLKKIPKNQINPSIFFDSVQASVGVNNGFTFKILRAINYSGMRKNSKVNLPESS